jgi:hypothetical protein
MRNRALQMPQPVMPTMKLVRMVLSVTLDGAVVAIGRYSRS